MPGHIAGGDSERARHAEEDMGIILADAGPNREGMRGIAVGVGDIGIEHHLFIKG
jgi:hypothetical protein